MVSPFLLKYNLFYNIVDSFMESLEYQEYKGAFIGAIGGMIGSGLAVTSALWMQSRAEMKQKEEVVKKRATIVYYDIELFYQETDILGNRIREALRQKNIEAKIEYFVKLRDYAGIHIDENWISNVAELKHVLGETTIKNIYRFYGKISELKRIIYEPRKEISEGDIKTADRLLYEIGKKDLYYKANDEMKIVLEELDKLMRQ